VGVTASWGDGRNPGLVTAMERAREAAAGAHTVVLVEGASDQAALETLAARRGRDLAAAQVTVVAMGGATNIGHFLALFGARGLGLRLAGLCDEAEEDDFRRGLQRAGLDGTGLAHAGHGRGVGRPGLDRAGLDRAGLERLGFFVCVSDLEDEMIRALGVPAVERVAETEGELRSLRTLRRQPAHRDTPPAELLRRFISTRSGRKARYGRLLAEAVDLAQIPRPLDRLLDYLRSP
jgi:Overcoming lysogenization defect protein-like, TOPRIM domain